MLLPICGDIFNIKADNWEMSRRDKIWVKNNQKAFWRAIGTLYNAYLTACDLFL